ncbi:GtrA family protein [Halolamina sp.]|jgi:putative flippase GtrA|uniref:GtrA family protein n=1 Tax=Halolamina sp. TaxID=1940283 RepID=UPI000223B746|nr:GtrA family protein [halophilic archaeon DL31]
MSAREELLTASRFGQFLSVGVVGAAFDITTSSVLTASLGVAPEVAKLIGAEVAIIIMFAINERWTFAGHGLGGRAAVLKRFLKSNLVRSGGVGVQVVVVYFLTRLPIDLQFLGVDLWELATFPIAIASSLLLNYILESLFTWRVTAE